jgi:hypothetical protein
MLALFAAAVTLAAHPVALIGYIALGVVARTVWLAIGYAAAWALVMQFFVMVTGTGFADPAGIAVQLGLRLAGSVVLTLAVFALYRVLRGRGNSGPGARRRANLRRVK